MLSTIKPLGLGVKLWMLGCTGFTPEWFSIVVRASARGAGGRGSIPDRITPNT